jgi:hypothetical protein
MIGAMTSQIEILASFTDRSEWEKWWVKISDINITDGKKYTAAETEELAIKILSKYM